MLKPILGPMILLILSVPATRVFAADEVTFLVAGSLIDTLEGKRIANPVVEIRGDRVVSVAAGGKIPGGAKVIDLGDATILPGLADMHTHLTTYDTDFGMEALALSTADYSIRGVVNARRALLAGFTAARNLGAAGFSDVALKNAINDGHIPGPRLQVSGPSIGATGEHCDNSGGDVQPRRAHGSRQARPFHLEQDVPEREQCHHRQEGDSVDACQGF